MHYLAPHSPQPQEQLKCCSPLKQEELNKLITASKSTTCSLDPILNKLLKELKPITIEPVLNMPAVIKALVKKPHLDPSELSN